MEGNKHAFTSYLSISKIVSDASTREEDSWQILLLLIFFRFMLKEPYRFIIFLKKPK